jgi:hypothetical protein
VAYPTVTARQGTQGSPLPPDQPPPPPQASPCLRCGCKHALCEPLSSCSSSRRTGALPRGHGGDLQRTVLYPQRLLVRSVEFRIVVKRSPSGSSMMRRLVAVDVLVTLSDFHLPHRRGIRNSCREFSIPVFKSTENQCHAQAPGWFSIIMGNRDTATGARDEALGQSAQSRHTGRKATVDSGQALGHCPSASRPSRYTVRTGS